MNRSIFIVDDDTELCASVTQLLAIEEVVVEAAYTLEAARSELSSKRFDLIVLDVMLPDGDGRALLKEIRSYSEVPIIMLTAKGDAGDRIAGLDGGADDYVSKPFVSGELLARIRAVLRRRAGAAGSKLMAGDLKIDTVTRRVLREDEEVALTAAEFDMLVLLVRRAGECVTRDELAEQVLGRPIGVADRSIDNHISSIRKKLGAQVRGIERIRSIRHLGYCYTGLHHA